MSALKLIAGKKEAYNLYKTILLSQVKNRKINSHM